jgi:hypothetical protein
LLKNYADINRTEERLGFTAVMMACHLNTESDSLRIVKLLCAHSFDKGKTRVVNVDATDHVGRSLLHHAAWTNKKQVCQFLIETISVDTTATTQNNEKAIDLTTDKAVAAYLANF